MIRRSDRSENEDLEPQDLVDQAALQALIQRSASASAARVSELLEGLSSRKQLFALVAQGREESDAPRPVPKRAAQGR